KVAEVEKTISDGTLKVFDTSKFTVNGQTLADGTKANVVPDDNYEPDTVAVSDGYFHESEYRSAPYFEVRIDGITEIDSDYKTES
ncbi:MAG TPA: BMP family ABC transporter substrate-binding protein, partial [Clostridiales bacterium]|nr:BMP family ABC transporter substrate-binding protein [Clostridiales bacterium]